MFMTSDSVPFKIVGWLMASQQKHRELLDFAKPIKMLEFIDVETNGSWFTGKWGGCLIVTSLKV